MKPLFAFFLILSTSLNFAQIGLPIQQSLLPKSSLVVNYDFSKSSSFTRGSAIVNNIAGIASGNASVFNSPVFMNSLGFVSLNGTNQYVMSQNLRTYFKSLNASVQKSFTMSLWIYPTSLNGVIVSEHESQVLNSGFFTSNIELVNGIVRFKVWDGVEVKSSAISLNQWYHIVMVYDGISLKGYLNGVLQGAQAYDRIIPTTGQFYGIGATSSTNMGSGAYGKFHLAQFKLHNLPLTDKDVLLDYEARKEEFDYYIHSPSTNSNPTYWNRSSVWDNINGTNGPGDAFSVHHYTPWLNSSLGWAAGANNTNQWITLSYDEPTFIKGFVVQGRANNGGQWVSSAHIDVSLNGTSWTRAISNAVLNSNSTDDVRIIFPNPVFAKFIRVSPLTWSGHITLRLGALVTKNNFTADNSLVLHYNPAITESYPGTGSSLIDLSGNGLNGAMSNLTHTGSSFIYNGTSSQVSIPDNALLEPGTGSWTIEVWFKNVGSLGTVIGKYNSGGASANISYALRIAGTNQIRADFSNGTTSQSTDNYTFNANNWVQMVYVWDKTNNTINTYSNGVLKQTKAISISGGILNATTNLFLGSYNGGEYPQFFNGQIGIVRLYKKAINASEVLNNFNSNRATYGL